VQNLNIKSEKKYVFTIYYHIYSGAIAHPSFGRIEGAAGQCSALLLAHPALDI
jgi:hypothetical protein